MPGSCGCDKAVTAFGLAAKATVQAAASADGRPVEDFVATARQRLSEAFELDVRVIVTTRQSDEAGDGVDANPLLATALRRHGSKLH